MPAHDTAPATQKQQSQSSVREFWRPIPQWALRPLPGLSRSAQFALAQLLGLATREGRLSRYWTIPRLADALGMSRRELQRDLGELYRYGCDCTRHKLREHTGILTREALGLIFRKPQFSTSPPPCAPPGGAPPAPRYGAPQAVLKDQRSRSEKERESSRPAARIVWRDNPTGGCLVSQQCRLEEAFPNAHPLNLEQGLKAASEFIRLKKPQYRYRTDLEEWSLFWVAKDLGALEAKRREKLERPRALSYY